MTFKEEVVKIAIDKLLFGLVLALFGYYLSRLIERFRTNLALSAEMNRTRVARIADVWEKLYVFEHEANTWTSSKNHGEAVQTLFGELHELMHKNRFWIGQKDFNHLNTYKILLNDLVQARAAGDASLVSKLESQVQTSKQTVDDIRDRLMAGDFEGHSV